MFHRRKHRTRRKSSHTKKNNLDRFLNYKSIVVIGVLFIIMGLYSSLASSGGSDTFYNMLLNFLKPSDEVSTIIEGQGLLTLLFYFVPVALALLISNFYAKNFNSATYITSILIVLYLIAIQIKISFFNLNFGEGCYYPNFFTASLFLFSIVLMLFHNAFIHRKPAILILTCIFFYISLVLYATNYTTLFDYLFSFTLFFSCLIYLVARKIERPFINLINFFLAIGFMGLFWLRKFVVNSKPEFLPVLFIFGALFYLFFYAIVILASGEKEKPLFRWMQVVMTGTNTLFYLGTTSYVIYKYNGPEVLWFFVLGLFLVNVLGIAIIKRYNQLIWTVPHYYITIILGALVLPLIFHQNRILLFTSSLSVMMLFYSRDFKDRNSLWISMGSLVGMIVYYLFSWLIHYFPALISGSDQPTGALMWHGIISGVLVMLALWLTNWLMNEAEIPLSKRRFSRTKYTNRVSTFLYLSLFLTIGWIGFSLGCILSGTTAYTSLGWFISGSIFFISLINYYAGKQSVFKRPLLYLAFLFALMYPLLVQWSMSIYREKLLLFGNLNGATLLLHYFSVILLGLLGVMVIPRIYKHNLKNIKILKVIKVLTIIFLGFLFCSEYDNLTVFFASAGVGPNNRNVIGSELLSSNHLLPYSILLWIIAVLVFIRSVFNHDRFLRNFSMFGFVVILIKLFVFDFETLSPGGRGAVFFVLGLFLIGFALLYPRLLKADALLRETERNLAEKAKQNAANNTLEH